MSITKNLGCFLIAFAVTALPVLFTPLPAHAEADSFGLGTGRDGALEVSAADTSINAYASVTADLAVGAVSVSVDGVAGFSAGQLVMLWQTTGLDQSAAPRGNQDTIDLGATSVGHYEFARIESVNAGGPSLLLTLPTINAYRANTAQVVRIPEYTTVNIQAGSSLVPAQVWDGSKGGVVAFFATGAITNNGVVSASAFGFRGGPLVNHGALNNCNDATMGVPDDNTPANGYSRKGEGLVPGAFAATIGGRTNVANAGGGGVCHNSGGGGGAHAGRGGLGGRTWAGDGLGRDLGGYGGAALSYDPLARLSFGGGGGAGDQNNNVGTAGGAGGGLVLIRAGSMVGTGVVRSNGEKPTRAGGLPASNDAAGGGGGGGAIVVRLTAALACTSIEANGGGGGDVQFSINTNLATGPHGPGGGGGGGRIFIESAVPSACPAVAESGVAGTWNDIDNWGATPTTSTEASSLGVVTIAGSAFTGQACTAAQIQAGICGGCVLNSECPGALLPVCNLATNACAGCAANFGGGAGACPTGGAPVCVDSGPNAGACGECADDADCGANVNGPVCDTSKNTCGVCTSSNAMSCTGTTAFCNTSVLHNQCAGCDGDAGGVSARACSASLPACVTAGPSTGLCVECLADGYCDGHSNGPLCDIGKQSCGACTSGNVLACMGLTPACDVSGAANLCAACNGAFNSGASRACASALLPLCVAAGPLTGACVQCLSPMDCGGATPICNVATGTCLACNGDFGSLAASACFVDAPFCTAGACSSQCSTDAQCGAGNWCNTGTCQPRVPNGLPVPGGSCEAVLASRACVSGVCDTNDNLCGLLPGNPTCTGTPQCRAGVCVGAGANAGTCLDCNTNAECSGGLAVCSNASNLCVQCTTSNASACAGTTPVCSAASSVCVACNGDAGAASTNPCSVTNPLCLPSGACTRCTANADCEGGQHGGPFCNVVTGACGAGCVVDADCVATEYCDNPSGVSGSCTPKLANGALIPAAAPFAGICSVGTAQRVCASGVCDTNDNRCGVINGEACANNAVCRSEICGADNLCGLPNGGSCADAVVCRSAVCFSDGACGSPNGQACTQDLTCRTGVCFDDDLCGVPVGQACSVQDVCRAGSCMGSICVGNADAGGLNDGGVVADGGVVTDAAVSDAGSADAAVAMDAAAGQGGGGQAGSGQGGAAGMGGSAGSGGADQPDDEEDIGTIGGGGFSCRVGGANAPPAMLWIGALAFLLWRRRRRS